MAVYLVYIWPEQDFLSQMCTLIEAVNRKEAILNAMERCNVDFAAVVFVYQGADLVADVRNVRRVIDQK